MERVNKRMVACNDKGYAIGDSHHRAKLTDAQVDLVHELRAAGWTQARLAIHLGVSRRLIRGILSGERRGQVATRWRPVAR